MDNNDAVAIGEGNQCGQAQIYCGFLTLFFRRSGLVIVRFALNGKAAFWHTALRGDS